MTLDYSQGPTADALNLHAVEQKLAALWSEVLQTPQLPGSDDNFFALGGDSLAMTILIFRVNDVFKVELQASVLADAPRLRDFSSIITSAARGLSQSSESRVL